MVVHSFMLLIFSFITSIIGNIEAFTSYDSRNAVYVRKNKKYVPLRTSGFPQLYFYSQDKQ
jgi:hypothetical protein